MCEKPPLLELAGIVHSGRISPTLPFHPYQRHSPSPPRTRPPPHRAGAAIYTLFPTTRDEPRHPQLNVLSSVVYFLIAAVRLTQSPLSHELAHGISHRLFAPLPDSSRDSRLGATGQRSSARRPRRAAAVHPATGKSRSPRSSPSGSPRLRRARTGRHRCASRRTPVAARAARRLPPSRSNSREPPPAPATPRARGALRSATNAFTASCRFIPCTSSSFDAMPGSLVHIGSHATQPSRFVQPKPVGQATCARRIAPACATVVSALNAI